MLELKIGDIEDNKDITETLPSGIWRFVLAKEDDAIVLYAGAALGERASFGHKAVATHYNLKREDLLGGGDISYSFGRLKFEGMSGDFGIVPNSVIAELSKIVCEIIGEKHKIETVEIDMWYEPGESNRKNPCHIERWRKLGYEFDNEKRYLELP